MGDRPVVLTSGGTGLSGRSSQRFYRAYRSEERGESNEVLCTYNPIKIFISYRRDDDPGFVQALYSKLESAFQRDAIFMDVAGHIQLGDDYILKF